MIAACWATSRATAADPSPDSFAAIQHVSSDNPYRVPLEQFLSLPDAQRRRLLAWSQEPDDGEAPAAPLTVTETALVSDLTAAVRQAALQPVAAVWTVVPDPNDPDNPLASTVPHASLLLQLGRVATRGAADLPSTEAINTYAAIAQMGRQTRNGQTLMEQLMGAAVEGEAINEVARRLGEFSAADLVHLNAAWADLRATPDAERVLQGERDLFFTPFLEEIFKPGLAALIAEQAALAEGATSANTGVGAELRLTALINDGQRMIGLENQTTGASFFVEEGKTVQAVTLVSIDFKRKRALLRVGGKEAVMDLASKRIVERTSDARRLLTLLGVAPGSSSSDVREIDASTVALLQRVRAHPGGLDGYIRDLQARYDAQMKSLLVEAENPRFVPAPRQTPSDDPLVGILVPSYQGALRMLHRTELTATMLGSAAALRLRQLDGKPLEPAPDRWGKNAAALQLETTPDGGFILGSVYEDREGRPVRFKFAAEDAGRVQR